MKNKLIINDLECTTTLFTYKLVNSNYNGIKGYSLRAVIEYLYENNKGKISYFIYNINSDDLNNLENTNFKSDLSNDMPILEMFYKNSFATPCDGILLTKFGKLSENTIETTITIKDNDLYNIYFKGYLSLK